MVHLRVSADFVEPHDLVGREAGLHKVDPAPKDAETSRRSPPATGDCLPGRRMTRRRLRHGRLLVVISDEERSKREGDLRELMELMRPAVQADGGDLELVSFDVESGEVEVELRGACSSCAISSATLQGGVERILKGRLDWVTEVRGGVDESEDFEVSVSLGRGGYVPKA